jgi:hypothetical protein
MSEWPSNIGIGPKHTLARPLQLPRRLNASAATANAQQHTRTRIPITTAAEAYLHKTRSTLGAHRTAFHAKAKKKEGRRGEEELAG